MTERVPGFAGTLQQGPRFLHGEEIEIFYHCRQGRDSPKTTV
jgi:hypothetical protein